MVNKQISLKLNLLESFKDTRLQDLRLKLVDSRKVDDNPRVTMRQNRFDRKTPYVQSVLLPDSHMNTATEAPTMVRKTPEPRNFSVLQRRTGNDVSSSAERTDSTLKVLERNIKFIDNLENFEVLQKLGKGAYAKVYLVRNRRDGKEFALKTYNKKEYLTKPQRFVNIRSEVEIMCRVSHPSIIKLEAICETDDKVRKASKDPHHHGKRQFQQPRRIFREP